MSLSASNGYPVIPGTSVEIAEAPPRGKVRHVLFDHDGTISYLRDGWQDFMVPMLVRALEECPRRESREDLERLVIDFVDHLTGKQTIYQMLRCNEEVQKRGGKPRDPLAFKREYYGMLAENLKGRMDALRSGKKRPDEFLVKGARGFLEDIHRRGLPCYLASGTDVEFVVEETKLLDLEKYFGDRVFGALPNYRDFSKEKVIRKILEDFNLSGPELLVVGDGYVEIQNGRGVGAVTWGVHTQENNRYHMNANKRERLLRAGAHILSDDLTEGRAVLDYLGVS